MMFAAPSLWMEDTQWVYLREQVSLEKGKGETMRFRWTAAAFTTAIVAAMCCGWGLGPRSAEASPEMTDQTISDKVEDQLLFDPGVVSTKIEVYTSDGIVTLTGEVNNILAKERAARVAETVKGVRAVVNRIDMSSAALRPDDQIRQDVEEALQADPTTRSYIITATVEDGEVTLTGSVNSYQQRDLAKIVAKGVRGVRAIEDRINVAYKIERPDEKIQDEIEQALRWNAHVDDHLVDVSVDNGEVTLSGVVGSAAEKRSAEYNAWVANVKSVDSSKLTVERWARDEALRGEKYVVKSEQEVQSAVKRALLHDPRVSLFDVTVDVTGSVVTLRGEVGNLKAKRAAEQDAMNTVGVSDVHNRLRVRPATGIADSEIAEDVRDALLRDPYINRFEITVTVVQGTVFLYGTVDSYFERNRADNLASRVFGVVEVTNHLRVDLDTPYSYDPYVDDAYLNQDTLAGYERRAPMKTDAEIKESIESHLWWSPFVNSNNVTVAVNNGIATLTGTVGSWSERQAATKNAYDGGATLVSNDLMIDMD
jgi:osmotically-inducible protein OsmY